MNSRPCLHAEHGGEPWRRDALAGVQGVQRGHDGARLGRLQLYLHNNNNLLSHMITKINNNMCSHAVLYVGCFVDDDGSDLALATASGVSTNKQTRVILPEFIRAKSWLPYFLKV